MMKLFPCTRTRVFLGSILVLVASQSALADGRGHNRASWTNNPAYRHEVNRGSGWNRQRNDNFYFNSFNSRNRHGNFISYRGDRYRPVYRHSNRYLPRSRDNWSVSVNLGSGYSSSNIWYGTSLYSGIGYDFYGSTRYGYSPYRSRTRTVVVEKPTVIYVNDSVPVSGRVTESPARSLLRDINGNCFERYYDSHGNETRVSLPASACQF